MSGIKKLYTDKIIKMYKKREINNIKEAYGIIDKLIDSWTNIEGKPIDFKETQGQCLIYSVFVYLHLKNTYTNDVCIKIGSVDSLTDKNVRRFLSHAWNTISVGGKIYILDLTYRYYSKVLKDEWSNFKETEYIEGKSGFIQDSKDKKMKFVENVENVKKAVKLIKEFGPIYKNNNLF